MPRGLLIAMVLPLVALLGGCKALVRDGETVEYRRGTLPSTTAARCDATYTLEVPAAERTSYNPVDVAMGELVGFRRESDGSLVAFAGAHTYTIPDQNAVWSFVPAPVTRWDRFAVGAANKAKNAVEAVTTLFLVPFIIYNGCTTGEWP